MQLQKDKATLVKEGFNKQFWNNEKKYLYDVVNGENKDDSLRPNQLKAICADRVEKFVAG